MAREQERDGGDKSSDETAFEAGQDGKTEEAFEYDAEAMNLVKSFKAHPDGRLALKRISEKCQTDFENAWAATDKFR